MNRSVILGASVGIVALIFFAVRGGPGSSSGLDTHLNRGLSGSPSSLDQHRFLGNSAANVLRDIGEGLLAYSANGTLVGGVAKSWAISKDGLIYTFEIRPDAKWENGDQVLASDFVFSFHRLFEPETASPYTSSLIPILNASKVLAAELPISSLGVRAIDNLTLEIELEYATAYFPQLLTHPSTFPLAQKSFQDVPNKLDKIAGPISNGAYRLENRVIGSELTLVRNEEYWNNEETGYDRVTYHVVLESAEVNRYRAGELDVTYNVDGAMFELMLKERPSELKVNPYLGIYYYGFNLTRGIFADTPDLRRALSMAVNREDLVTHIIGRGEEPAYGWVPPGIDGYEPRKHGYSQMSPQERENEARRLYESAGYGPGNPLKFELRYNTSDVETKIAVAVQSMWKDVLGAEATLVNEEFQVLISNIQEQAITEMFRMSWTGDYNDPLTFLELFQTSNPANFTGLSSSVVDTLLRTAATTVEKELRFQVLSDAEAAALESYPVIPLYYYVSKHLVRDSVAGWEDNVLDIHYSKHLRPRPAIE
jgi:oligopeptide transport system substrate-binding protein